MQMFDDAQAFSRTVVTSSISLTPCANWVETTRWQLRTVSTISPVCAKPLKRFVVSATTKCTQLKQGVNERSLLSGARGATRPTFRLAEGEVRIAHPFKGGLAGEVSLSPVGTAESFPQIPFNIFNRLFGTRNVWTALPGSELPGYYQCSLRETPLQTPIFSIHQTKPCQAI